MRAFANKYIIAQISLWFQVKFSNEKIYERRGRGLKRWVTERLPEKYNEDCFQQCAQKGIFLQVWGIIGWDGVGSFPRVDRNLNAETFQPDIMHEI